MGPVSTLLGGLGLGDLRTGARRRACGPLRFPCQRTRGRRASHTALLPAPAPVELGLRRWLCPQAGFWGWLRLLGLAQVPRQAPWSQGPPFFVPVILVGAAGFYGDSISSQLAVWGSGCWPSPLNWWAFLSYSPKKARRVVGRGWSCRVPEPDWPRKGKSQGLSSGPQPSPVVQGAWG